jgi:hypothetical protein
MGCVKSKEIEKKPLHKDPAIELTKISNQNKYLSNITNTPNITNITNIHELIILQKSMDFNTESCYWSGNKASHPINLNSANTMKVILTLGI